MVGQSEHRAKVHVVTKSDAGLGAPYLVGAFADFAEAEAACVGVGTYLIATVALGRAYRSGTMLDVVQIDTVNDVSLRLT